MAEYKLSYTGKQIDDKLHQIEQLLLVVKNFVTKDEIEALINDIFENGEW